MFAGRIKKWNYNVEELSCEEDGSITDIRAFGDDTNLNKQAEIALYLFTENSTKPATLLMRINAVRYSFSDAFGKFD